MCLILLALQPNPRYRFIVAANRDEYYKRPAKPAKFWVDCPRLLAGRDLTANGTWLGITRNGKFAAVTNYYEIGIANSNLRSRGNLTSNFLTSEQTIKQYSSYVNANKNQYNGYGLLFGSFTCVRYMSNKHEMQTDLTNGIHGLSNHHLNSPWPRVQKGIEWFKREAQQEAAITPEILFNILLDVKGTGKFSECQDSEFASTSNIPDMPMFLRSKDFGTRSATVIIVEQSGAVYFEERTYDDSSESHLSQRQYAFTLK